MRVAVVLAGLALAAPAPRLAMATQSCRPGGTADLRGVADGVIRRAIQVATGAVRMTEAGESVGDVTCDAVLALRALDVRTGVTSLRGIGLLANLERLSVGERFDYYKLDRDPPPLPAAALGGLAELPRLRSLSLGPVADLAPVAALGALEELNVDRVASADLSPLRALAHLRVLQIGTGDPNAWQGNPNPRSEGLVYALARGGGIADLGALAGLKALEVLEIEGARVVDLAPLAGLSALRILNLQENAIADLGPLARLTKLQVLLLKKNQITDVAPLRGLTALVEVRLGNNPIVDGAPLAELTALRELWLDTTKVADARPFAAMASLETLYLCFSPATEKPTRANRAVLRALRKRGVTAPEFRGCHCC